MSKIVGNKLVLLLGLFAVAVVVVLALRQLRHHDFPNAKARTLFFADGGSTLSALLYTAYEKTFFFTQKVNFHLSFYPSGREALNALTSGKADLATVADTPIVHSILDGNDFVILATIAHSRTSLGIIGLENIKKPQDLRGKKVGYYPGTNSEFFLHEFLIKHEISKSDLVLVPIQPAQAEENLGQGRIHAIAAFDPHLSSIAKLLGKRVHIFFEPDIYVFSWNVVASRRLLDHPDTLENIIRALHVAERYVKENPEQAIEITSRYLRMSQNQARELWSNLHLETNLSQSLIVNLERQAKWAADTTDPDQIPDFGKYIYSNAIKTIIPNRVTIIE